jgi:hypothetical protein
MSCLTLLIVKPVNAQSIPTPTIPTFTLKYLNASYSVTTTDPYTGATTTQQKDNSTIEISIKNQPFTYSYNNTNYYLYYNIGYKGHFEHGNWTYLYHYISYTSSSDFIPNMFPATKNSEYTIALIPANFPADAKVDFEVQAIEMHDGMVPYYPHLSSVMLGQIYYEHGVVFGQSSDWSNIETINLADDSVTVSTSANPNVTLSPTPTVPELSWLIILPLFLSGLFVTVIVRHRKNNGKGGNRL